MLRGGKRTRRRGSRRRSAALSSGRRRVEGKGDGAAEAGPQGLELARRGGAAVQILDLLAVGVEMRTRSSTWDWTKSAAVGRSGCRRSGGHAVPVTDEGLGLQLGGLNERLGPVAVSQRQGRPRGSTLFLLVVSGASQHPFIMVDGGGSQALGRYLTDARDANSAGVGHGSSGAAALALTHAAACGVGRATTSARGQRLASDLPETTPRTATRSTMWPRFGRVVDLD